jgi:putative transposase
LAFSRLWYSVETAEYLVDEVADGVVLELLRHRHQNHTGLPQFADIHLDHELIAEESRHRVHQDQVKRASGRGGGVNHALKLGPTVISGGSSSFVDGRIRSPRVIKVLSRLESERGAPRFLRSDNGPGFVSRKLPSWIVAQNVDIALIEPGKPWQNGVGESVNRRSRDECLSLEWFRSRAEAKVVIERWRRYDNEVRPHSSLGDLMPAEFAARMARPAPHDATGRGAAVCQACAPRPVASPSRLGQPQQTRAVVSR